jgi:cell division protein FtsB
MRLKGRHWLMLWLLAFLVVAVVVTAQQTAAIGVAKRVGELREERATLEARRADLERRIRQNSDRRVLARKVEQTLGLHHPEAGEFQFLVVPSAVPADKP